MDKKYYLDDLGVIRILQKISEAINSNTSSSISIMDVEDSETGLTSLEVQNPNKFATVKAVFDYVANLPRHTLTIVKQSAVEDSENGYSVQNNISEYDGSNAALINFNIIDNEDIKRLFLTN